MQCLDFIDGPSNSNNIPDGLTFANVAIFGASGAIGSALIMQLVEIYPNSLITAISQQPIEMLKRHFNTLFINSTQSIECTNLQFLQVDYQDESTLRRTAETLYNSTTFIPKYFK